MENSLTFKTDTLDHGARSGMAAQFVGPGGAVKRNGVRIGKGGQPEAREQLRQWARENGWNG